MREGVCEDLRHVARTQTRTAIPFRDDSCRIEKTTPPSRRLSAGIKMVGR